MAALSQRNNPMKLATGGHSALGGESGPGKVWLRAMDSETIATACQWAPPPSLRDLEAGASGFVAEMIADFTTDTTTRLQHLRRAAANADSSRVRAEVHAIRGSAREMGADAIVRLCVEIERETPDPNASNIKDCIRELEARFGEVSRAMARYSTE